MAAVRNRLALWVQTIRPFAFSASVIPVLVAASFAFAYYPDCDWILLPVILVCAMLFHAGTNVVSEYFDFKRGVDKKETFGSSRVLVEGLLSPREVLRGGIVLFAAGCLLGGLLIVMRGWGMLVFASIGLLGGIGYTAWPVGYKYRGLGDIMVFLLMGPLMVAGAYYSLTGFLSARVIWVSIPVGLLVAAILNANNTRDIVHDREAGVVTLEILLGPTFSKYLYVVLVGMAYVSVLIMAFTGIVHYLSLIVCFSLPLAFRTIATIVSKEPAHREFVTLDVQTAQLHMAFGVLLCVSFIARAFMR